MVKANGVYLTLMPMFYVTKVLGLTPFKLGRQYEHSYYNLFYSLFFTLFITCYSISGLETGGIDSQIIAEVTALLDALMGLSSMSLGVLSGCIFRKDTLQALQGMTDFDEEMCKHLHVDLRKEYRKNAVYAALILFFMLLFASVHFTFSVMGTYDLMTFQNFGELLNYTVPYLMNTFMDLQICSLLVCLKQRFRWINEKIVDVAARLQSSLEECDQIFLKVEDYTRPITHTVATGIVQDKALFCVEMLRKNHYRLCGISRGIQKAYSMQMLLIIMQSFITIIVSLYYSGKYAFVDKDISTDYIVYSSIQCSTSFGQLFILVLFCSMTAQEAKKAGVLIHKAASLGRKIRSKFKDNLQLEVTFFSLQLMHQTVDFTACRIFVVNETLIFNVFGAIATYLIIVIQFEAGNVRIKKAINGTRIHGNFSNETFH